MENNEIEAKFAPQSAPESLLTTDAVANWLGIKRCTLEKARSTRLGDFPPYIKVGRTVRYRREAVQAWLQRHELNSDGTPT